MRCKRIAEEGSGVVVILRQPESPRDLVEAVRALENEQERQGRGRKARGSCEPMASVRRSCRISV